MRVDGDTSEGISRRHLLGTGIAASAGALVARLPGAAARPRRRRRRRADVAIVGAGFAGLTAARAIERAGHSAIVLEARGRVGGRALNANVGRGEISERGATFAGPTQDHVIALARELGVELFPTFNEGENMYIADGSRLRWSDTGPTGTAPPDPVILPDLARVVAELDEMSKSVPVDAPWRSPNAPTWDSQTLEDWINAHSLTPQFRELVPLATRPIFGAEPRELSLLFVLFYIAASGNEKNVGTFERNFNTRDGAQMFRFEGGTQPLCERMARRLDRGVILEAPVRRVVGDRGGITVHADGHEVRAKRVIIAIPPALTGRIEFEPDLPEQREGLIDNLPQGNLTKVAAVYERPFWREDGLTGQVIFDRGPVNVTFDDSPADASLGIVFGFIGGDQARTFARLSRKRRRAAVLENLTEFFGPEAASPLRYLESAWKRERWTRGCPVAIAAPGTLFAHGPALRKPVGRIHWAGSETSTYWNGYMDGAVRSGERAAAEVLERL